MIFTESSNAHPSFIPDEMKPRILCFGDSLTWGSDPAISGHRLPGRWPRVLQATLGPGYEVIEEGQGGRNIATDDIPEGGKNGIKYIRPCLETHNPFDMLIIMLGTNDLKRKFSYSSQDVAWSMERFLQTVLTHRQYSSATHYDILLISPPPMNEGLMTSWLGDVFEYDVGLKKSTELKKWYEELAQRYGIGFLDAGQCCESSQLDGIHLDAENHRKLGEAVVEYVKGTLALGSQDFMKGRNE